MVIGITIKTLDRSPKRNYLGETLHNLGRAGMWASRIPFRLAIVDSGSPDPGRFLDAELYPNIPGGRGNREIMVSAPGVRRTHNENAIKAAEIALDMDPEWFLHLEDDIDVCDRFLESALAWLEDHRGLSLLYSLGTTWPAVAAATLGKKRCCPYPIDQFYGAQAYAVHREWLTSYAAFLARNPFYGKERLPKCHDLLLHKWAREVRADMGFFLASAPSFVQHVGEESVLGNRHFTFPTWPGRGWSYKGKK